MRLLDTAEIKDIQSLISNENLLRVKVNFYQRPYRWTAKKVTDLFEDYKDNLESSAKDGNSQEYFIGAVVLVDVRNDNEKKRGKVWKYQVVDGQQRFTTLFLFNLIKYMLLVRKVDDSAQMKKSKDFNKGLEAMENCYSGFIGTENVDKIIAANRELQNAFDTANQEGDSINKDALNNWRSSVGWIKDPNIASEHYYDDCCIAMKNFLKNESLGIIYQNDDFNNRLKDALSRIVFKYSNAFDACFCEEAVDDYDDNDDTSIEFPYVERAYGIFSQIKKMNESLNHNTESPYEKLCRYINSIDEMLVNIKLCMIVTSNEDDAYKLFETLNDRSESVNDLELLKNYFFKAYTETSGEDKTVVYKNISSLDSRWRDIFFKYECLEPEIFEYMTVFFTGDTSKNTNEKKRKLIKEYLNSYDSNNRYTFDKISRDFEFMENIQTILLNTHCMDMKAQRKRSEDVQLSLYIENDPRSSIVKRALGLAMNIPYPVVVGSLICDIIHNYVNDKSGYSDFNIYLNTVFDDSDCKEHFPGLWKDACVIWKSSILSKNFESPKKLSDVLAQKCNVKELGAYRDVNNQLVQFDSNLIDENMLISEFDDWIKDWDFRDKNGKIKIKNLFMHLFLKYDLKNDKLLLEKHITREYAKEAIKQDLDHMDACKVNRQEETKYFHYNLSDRTKFTNSLGNMMPLPVTINRGKHNTPMAETIAAFDSEKLKGWIFEAAKADFKSYSKTVKGNKVPTEEFFEKRMSNLIEYFKKIVINQKINPDQEIDLMKK